MQGPYKYMKMNKRPYYQVRTWLVFAETVPICGSYEIPIHSKEVNYNIINHLISVTIKYPTLYHVAISNHLGLNLDNPAA